MIRFDITKVAFGCTLFGLVCLVGGALPVVAQDEDDPLVQMIVELVADADRDMRALGMQQVREQVPGEAATRKFAAVLPTLSTAGQVGLLEALGDRQDKAAQPAVLEMLDSDQESVRAAAIGALGSLGGASDVPLLAAKTAAGSTAERDAARASLVRLRGEDVNGALVAAMSKSQSGVQVELLGILASRNAKETLPSVFESTKAAEPPVRLAALAALRFLADEKDIQAIVDILLTADDASERAKARLTLLAVCGHGGEDCIDALNAGLDRADAPGRVVLLHGLARAGGEKALTTVAASLEDDDESVRLEAMRMLSIWPDATAVSHLLAAAEEPDSLRDQVLALRGLVRLAGSDVARLSEAMKLASRPEEKRLVIGALGGVGEPDALMIAMSALDDPALVEEAALAAVAVGEKMKDGYPEQVRAVLKLVLERTSNESVRQRAQNVLKSL